MTNAVSYLRVSGKGQIDGDGFERQRTTIKKYARANKIKIKEEYKEEGISGTKELENRSALASLLDRIETNGIKIVLVEKADRLARDLMVSEVILGQFRDAGVSVISADNGTDLTAGDSNDPTSKLIRQVLGAVAEFDKDVTVLKLRAARERKRRTGTKCEGRKAYGEKIPAEKLALERIRQLIRKPRNQPARTYAEIAEVLNEEEVPTRMGNIWNRGTVYAIAKRNGWSKVTNKGWTEFTGVPSE